MSLLVDFGRALAQIGDPRFRAVLWRALLMVIGALVAVSAAVLWLVAWLVPDTVTLPLIGQTGALDTLAILAAVPAMLILSVVTMAPATAAVAGFFLDDVADAVEARHYRGLPPAQAPSRARQAVSALGFLALMLAANAAALMIWLVAPPFAPIAFWLANGFLLGREYFQMVAERRLPPAEVVALRRRHGRRIWIAGVLMAIPLSLPLANLVVPILGVAVFTHLFHRLAPA